MSSHHFVKEGQEPALFVLEPVAYPVVAPLLEWAPLVLVAGEALEEALSWGMKIDIVLTHTALASTLIHSLEAQMPVKILQVPLGEDALSAGLKVLVDHSQTSVNILAGATDDRLHAATQAGGMQMSFVDGRAKWSLMRAGRFEKWLPAGTTLSVHQGLPAQQFEFNGLSPSDGHLHTASGGLARIVSDQLFWVRETL